MKDRIGAIVDVLNGVLLGKDTQIRLALACLLARGHLLIEDLPGMGKTLLSHALARTLGLSYNRIQFTSDVLPSDIIGTSIFERDSGTFRFVHGPLFAQVVLADEINRATPKSQSALLEAMEEQQVTADGETRPLPEPFFVIATQNPATQTGTFPLPESQLDRFLMRIELGYPDEVLHAILAHRPEFTGVEPETRLDEVLYACDELSGLVYACCLVRPNGIDDLKPKSVTKKLKDKAFAAGVNRDDVAHGVELIGLERSEHIQNVIDGMRAVAEDLGIRSEDVSR